MLIYCLESLFTTKKCEDDDLSSSTLMDVICTENKFGQQEKALVKTFSQSVATLKHASVVAEHELYPLLEDNFAFSKLKKQVYVAGWCLRRVLRDCLCENWTIFYTTRRM